MIKSLRTRLAASELQPSQSTTNPMRRRNILFSERKLKIGTWWLL